MDDVYNNIDDFQPTKKRKNLIVFDDIIADITTNIKFHTIIQELFIRCRKLNISLVFTTQSYFSAPKEARLNSTHYSITKIYNKREPQQIVINHSEDIDYKYFMNVYKKCTSEPYSIFTIDTTLPANDPFRFRKNLSLLYKNDFNWWT